MADIDGDGRDAAFVGYALVDHDETVLFDHQDRYGIDRTNTGMHSDANAMARLSDGQWRLLYGNHGVHCLAPDGREIWHHAMDEAQHVVAGRFVDETSQQVAVVNRGTPRNERGAADLHLFDVETGCEIWKRTQPPGAWGANCQEIRWTGRNGLLDILVAGRGPGRPVSAMGPTE